MKTVRQMLQSKGHELYSISPVATVYQALEAMANLGIGALIVLDDEGKLVGIFSERDYARNVALKGKSSHDTPVSEIMVTRVISVAPDYTVDDCMNLMTDKRIRHLPVIEGGSVIGMLSIGDLVKETIEHQKFLISQLESYIRG